MPPKMKRRDFPLELKTVEDAGKFSGYASVYDVIDSYKEIVAPGAFEKTLRAWKAKDRLPPVLWQHNSREPVGPYEEMHEDAKGLFVAGRLLVDDVQRAREARALMKAKAVGGLSIGFAVVDHSYNKETGIVTLNEVDLWEVSIVTFPANEAAQIETVKHMMAGGQLPNAKEFEEILREAGFSRAQSRCIVSKGYATLLREADSGKTVDAKSILDEVLTQSTITLRELGL